MVHFVEINQAPSPYSMLQQTGRVATQKLVPRTCLRYLQTTLIMVGGGLVSEFMSGIVDGFRSSRPEVFCKKGVLKNFAKFTGNHVHQNLFFNKVAGLRPATLLKKETLAHCFPVNFVKFL